MKLKQITATSMLLLLVANINASTYYASPTGGGDGLSYASPTTLTKGLSALKAGDTLYLLGGQYDFTSPLSISKTGTADNMIVIAACSGETPIFDFRNEPYGSNYPGVKLGGKYTHLKGITIRYAGDNGLYSSGAYNIMELLDVYGNCDTGIQQKNTTAANTILNCDSHDNCDYKTTESGAANYGGNADGFADKQFTGPGNTYIGCRAWNNSDDGWDFYQRVSNGSVTIIKDCICYRNGPASYDFTNYPRREKDATFFANFTSDGKVIVKNYGNGNGFKLGGGSTVHNVTLYRCLSVGNTVKGFDQNNDIGTMTVYNCTAYANATNYGFANSNGTLDIENCISHKGAKSNSFKTTTTQKNNTWSNTGLNCSDADFASLDTTVILSARDADGNLPVTDLLRLQSTSKLIDAGVILDGIDYTGSAPDLGCYEYASATGLQQTAVETADGECTVYNMAGCVVAKGRLSNMNLGHGVYIISYGAKTFKRLL